METVIVWIIDKLSNSPGVQTLLICGLLVFSLLLILRYRFHKADLLTSGGREDIWARLEKHGEWRESYLRGLRRTLEWVDSKLEARPLLNGGSYDFAQRMAFVYPIVSLLLIWVVTGQNTSGIPQFLPEDTEAWRRVLVLIALSV